MKVKFVPQNVELEIQPGQSVMHLAEDNGIYVKSVCRGVPSCAECRVKIVDGESNVFPPAGEELLLIGSGWFIDRRRLSCQLQCLGDVTVDMTEQLAKQSGQIGGRKSKIAKAIGDRVEDETVIRDSSNTRDRGAEGASDRDSEAPEENSSEEVIERQPEAKDSRPRPQAAQGPIVPRPQGSGGGSKPVGNEPGLSRPQPRNGNGGGGNGKGRDGGGRRRR